MGVYNNVGLCVPQIIGTIQRFLDIEVVYVVVAFVSCICGFVCCFMSIKTTTTQLHVSMVGAQYPHIPHLFNLAAIAPVFRVPHQQSDKSCLPMASTNGYRTFVTPSFRRSTRSRGLTFTVWQI